MDDVDNKAEDHIGGGIRTSGYEKKEEEQVSQPLRVSLSLRTKRFWNYG